MVDYDAWKMQTPAGLEPPTEAELEQRDATELLSIERQLEQRFLLQFAPADAQRSEFFRRALETLLSAVRETAYREAHV